MKLKSAERNGLESVILDECYGNIGYWILIFFVTCGVATKALRAEGGGSEIDPSVTQFLTTYCTVCHDEETQKADRRFDSLGESFSDEEAVLVYREILDQLNLGQMPPDKKNVLHPKPDETRRVVEWITRLLKDVEDSDANHDTILRRLNRVEYRNSMSELQGVSTLNIDPTADFPPDDREHGFVNFGKAQVTSDSLMLHYLRAADAFLDLAIDFTPAPNRRQVLIGPEEFETKTKRARSQNRWRLLNGDRVEIGHGYPEQYINFPSKFAERGVESEGYYRIRVKAIGLNRLDHPYTEKDIRMSMDQKMQLALGIAKDREALLSSARDGRRIAAVFELADNRAKTYEAKVWMNEGSVPFFNWINGIGNPRRIIWNIGFKYHRDDEEIIYNMKEAERLHLEPEERKHKPVGRVISEVYQGPRIGIYSVEIDGPIVEDWPSPGHRRIFGDANTIEEVDCADVIRRFAERAFRRPVSHGEVQDYIDFVDARIEGGEPPLQAVKWGLKAILMSPRFLYFDEGAAGPLDDYQLATRLSYFLWRTLPDEELLAAAKNGDLQYPEKRSLQASRMLRDERANEFVVGFTEAWLRLDKLGGMPPDPDTFKSYYKDRLEEDMLAETHSYFEFFLNENLPVGHMLNSDFTFVNADLANHYGLSRVEGPELRKVPLPENSRRGGLLGHASILTLTANGVETSPVVRGIWVLENILGTPPSPPPSAVEPLEPDLRGATTIREQLRKHREVETCTDCHQKIDPLGFPLEYFDPVGNFRKGYSIGKNEPLQEIDGFGEMPSGEILLDERDLKAHLAKHDSQFARTIVSKLMSYAIGRPMTFRDEGAIQEILSENSEDDYRLRQLVLGVVSSGTFATK